MARVIKSTHPFKHYATGGLVDSAGDRVATPISAAPAPSSAFENAVSSVAGSVADIPGKFGRGVSQTGSFLSKAFSPDLQAAARSSSDATIDARHKGNLNWDGSPKEGS